MTNAREIPIFEYYSTWNTTSDVDTFLSIYNHANNYTDSQGYRLPISGTIRINDGIYNVDWLIAGFDCEKSRVASDNTTYDNGYGIALIPKTYVGSASKWNSTDTVQGAYYSSYIRNNTLPPIANNLKSILGSHLINRNVLLSNSVDSSNYYESNGYIWTTDYCTLMSTTQLGKEIATGTNKYDDGEANYKLDLFSDDVSRQVPYSNYWTRGVYGYTSGSNHYGAWNVDTSGIFLGKYVGGGNVRETYSIRPLVYIR